MTAQTKCNHIPKDWKKENFWNWYVNRIQAINVIPEDFCTIND